MSVFTSENKNSSTFTAEIKSGAVSYITTDVPDFVLVGQGEADFLVWQDGFLWTADNRN